MKTINCHCASQSRATRHRPPIRDFKCKRTSIVLSNKLTGGDPFLVQIVSVPRFSVGRWA